MLNLIIFGPPGAGKGTQAELIARKYRLTHLSSGDILRRARNSARFGRQIKKYQDIGKLVPDSLVIRMVEANAAKKIAGGLIFDGYPRNLRQARSLDKFFKAKKAAIAMVLNLRLSEKEAAQRIMTRGKTSGRSDDRLATIKKRFAVYRAQTAPLLKYYRTQRKLITVDGRSDIKTVFRDISAKIKTFI
jgi:adenylate kinase